MPTDLSHYGWRSFFAEQLEPELAETIVPVRVIGVQKSALHILGPQVDAEVDPVSGDYARPCAVGDWLLFDQKRQVVVRRLARMNELKRRAPGTDRQIQLIAANIDTLFVMSACNQDFNEARLERYLALAREACVMAVVVLTRADIADDPALLVKRAAKLARGVHVEAVNALERGSLRCLEPWLQEGQTVALLGSSGVGKSTLTNTLLGRQQIDTQGTRSGDDKGRHTTSARSLYVLPAGAWLLDSPGMRELQLMDVRCGIDDVFVEISALAASCRFADCTHEGEPGCAVREAMDRGDIDPARMNRWRKLVREEAYNRESIAERRARGRATGRLYKSIIRDKETGKRR